MDKAGLHPNGLHTKDSIFLVLALKDRDCGYGSLTEAAPPHTTGHYLLNTALGKRVFPNLL